MSEIRKRPKSNTSKTETGNENKDKNQANKQEKNIPKPNEKLTLRILSRGVVIFSLLFIVYFTSKEEKFKQFAKQNELLPGKGLIVDCSPKYLKDVNQFEGCFPKECKRYVTDTVISVSEAEEMLKIAKKAFQISSSSGSASILDLYSGALSHGKEFINLHKSEGTKDLIKENDFNIYRIVKDKVKQAVAHHFGVSPSKIYLAYPTFFSEITSKKAVTVMDEYWHPHVDTDTYNFHYTTLLYLSDYDIDFKGGRFIFIDEAFNSTIEPRRGRLSMFTSGAENLHYVEKVQSGSRYAVTIPFTCDKKYAVKDPITNKY